ncbi:MAG TPA: transporter, partial [Gemmatimonadota bacterium]|nr:transporter [Gemmatimonadota bacterium]
MARSPSPLVFLVAALAGLNPGSLAGQEGAPLVTDRPDFTESAVTVPRGDVQLESGYTFTRSDEEDEHSLGEVLARIGLVERLEARIGFGSHAWITAAGNDPSGFEDPSVG